MEEINKKEQQQQNTNSKIYKLIKFLSIALVHSVILLIMNSAKTFPKYIQNKHSKIRKTFNIKSHNKILQNQLDHKGLYYKQFYSEFCQQIDYNSISTKDIEREHTKLLHILQKMNNQLTKHLTLINNRIKKRKVKTQTNQTLLPSKQQIEQQYKSNQITLNIYKNQFDFVKKRQIHLKLLQNHKDSEKVFDVSQHSLKHTMSQSIEKVNVSIRQTKRTIKKLQYQDKKRQIHPKQQTLLEIQEKVRMLIHKKQQILEKIQETETNQIELSSKFNRIEQIYKSKKLELSMFVYQYNDMQKQIKEKQQKLQKVDKYRNKVILEKQRVYRQNLHQLEAVKKQIKNIQQKQENIDAKNQQMRVIVSQLQVKFKQLKTNKSVKQSQSKSKKIIRKQRLTQKIGISLQNIIKDDQRKEKQYKKRFQSIVKTESLQNIVKEKKQSGLKIERMQQLGNILRQRKQKNKWVRFPTNYE